MPTKPPKKLLDRDLFKAFARERIDIATPLLQEVVNHGLAAFARCSHTAKDGDEKLAILMPYLHLLEMIDGVHILVADAAPDPAQLQLRSAFEALLTIEYITRDDTMRRAHAYLVADIHRRLAKLREMVPGTEAWKRARKRMEADAVGRTLRLEGIVDAKAGIEKLEGLLQKPHGRAANAAYQRAKKKRKGRPAWYELYGGPTSLELLATHLKRPAQYDILYRPWSETSHAGDAIYRKLTKAKGGAPAVRQLRDLSQFDTIVSLAVTFVLNATIRVLNFYRPEEMPAFHRWYTREVRETYMKFGGS